MTPAQKPTVADKWQSLPMAVQRSIMRSVIQQSRDQAANVVMMESQGSDNDIVKQATDARLAQMPLSDPTL